MNYLSTLEEIKKFRRNNLAANLIIDTNILLLLFVGVYNLDYLPSCPLFKDSGHHYTSRHFELLSNISKIFLGKVVITPHILSEINSLSRNRIISPHRDPHFQKMIEQLAKIFERSISLNKLLSNLGLMKFGFTDMSIIELAKENKNENWVILTNEFELYRNFHEVVPMISFSQVEYNELSK